MVTKDDQTTCDGYLRPPHPATPALYLQLPDETRKALCQTCALRWLLSDEEWPPKKAKLLLKLETNEDKTPISINLKDAV